ncbi:MAG: trypsin-like peptidase domain-containing protein [Actinobacteria bacterium]|nr:trypsin-like peptidase domain-containing protein [Actinomycetota bacterium]
MKKFTIIALLVSIIFLVACVNLDNFIPIGEYNSKVEELEIINKTVANKDKEIGKLNRQLDYYTDSLALSKEETVKYKRLINNLNELLSNVYYGYASNENWISGGFTAFSIEYNGDYYLITAGHCVHYKDDKIDTGLYTSFKFKANFSNEWIYPKLLIYEVNDTVPDYAILFSDKINDGLDFDLDNSYPNYVLGNGDNNILKGFYTDTLIDGESGSPVVDINGQVVGIATGNFVDIDIVLQTIDDLN